MTTWFISRHPGAIEWIKKQNIHIDRFVQHLDVSLIQKGDIVIGTLPVHMAAEVCEKGAKFYFLSINMNFEQRGKELTVEDLITQGCRIVPYYVEQL
ncbi:CRISPR-associated protein Csx16 [Gallibacterium anatis]|uniref:CRISPR-associated protein n=1 Tax=Gallibacterium anatis TaxID=750 RepID=A0A0A2YLT6_9PAST|nr:CRISPR-associated protein Csx16 [Gallibacterium anatis]KGQ28738.1 CRISPR-associated protein [Gallibacterium anatis]KGQ45723.1 CRISPR-associated protein [Gallibacterium anatis]MDK9430396.1 CRISPR-associated protein Csx16 [Gallibacterium anatis]OBW96506.1 CRISPR-associated protein [Gallibacterium anatis]OBW98546.1 CRISPR-associated protein [Gallibacterium anatis]